MVGNDWSEKYDEITNEMPVNDAEKRVLQMLQKGSTILEAREANGLSDVCSVSWRFKKSFVYG